MTVWVGRPPPRRGFRGGLRFTTVGRLFVLLALGVGFAAVNTGNNLLYLVLGLLLSLIILSGMLSDVVLIGVVARRRLPRRAFVDAPCLVELELQNQKAWLPSFSLAAEDVIDPPTPHDAARRTYFLKLDPRRKHTASYLRVPTRRGVLRFAHVRVSTQYPFGFFDKWRLQTREDELVVFPAVVAVPDLERALDRLTAMDRELDEQRASSRASGLEIAGLRPHRDGDEARSVHARRSAALGSLVVRELERPSSHELLVRVRLAGESTLVERRIARAASVAQLAHARGLAVTIAIPGERGPRVAPDASIDPLLHFLALVDPSRVDDASPWPSAHRIEGVLDVPDAPGATP